MKKGDLRGSSFWDIAPCNPLKVNDISEEQVSIFRVAE
jgi:hypothetical protein